MGNKLPPYDNEQVETAISEEIRKEQAGEPGYDLAKLDLGKFKNHSPSPWVINSPSMTLNSGSTVMAELYVNNMVEPDDYCLIAAAPDLLAELKEARKEIEELREKVRFLQEFYDITQGVMGMVERTLDGSITSTKWPFEDPNSVHIPENKE